MALAQIKHRPQFQGLVTRHASARRRLPRRALRRPLGLNRPVLATNHLGASYYGLSYDNQGRRATMTKGTGVSVSYAYDGLGRLSSMTNDLAGVIYDISYGFGYNPASQIVSQSTSNAVYDYKETAAIVDAHAFNGLNQDASIAAVAGGYDAGGNMAKDGTRVMVYDVYNRLLSVANAATPTAPFLTLDYDVEGRLFKSLNNGVTLRFRYDGTKLIGEYFNSGAFYRHYVHGVGVDEPVVWFDGEQFTTPRYYVQNYQGSVIAFTGPTGNMGELYKYGPYGEPKNVSNADSWTGSRFRYTGQTRLDSGELYYYKARVYDPKHGRFLQTDPIGSKDDLDLYAYTGGDPVNKTDPDGMEKIPVDQISQSGKLDVRAYGGPKVTDRRAEHGPDHIHVKDGKVDVRINTQTWKPLAASDAKAMTRNISGWVKGLSGGAKDFISAAQRDIFNTGKISAASNMRSMREFTAQRAANAEAGQRSAEAKGRLNNIPSPYRAAVKSAMKSGGDDD